MAEGNKVENVKECIKTTIEHDTAGEINQMLHRILNKADVNIKSQQRTEIDLTDEQKMQILKDTFEQSPHVFLARFGEWISVEDLHCFCAASGSDMEYAIDILKKTLKGKYVIVKNRRFEALQRLEKDTSYFSDDEMQRRCPFLYEQYIGQYITDEERSEKTESRTEGEVKLSTLIFRQIDHDWLKKKEQEEQEMEECVEEEEDDSEEHDEDSDEDKEVCDKDNMGHDRDKMRHDKDTRGDMEDIEATTSSEIKNLSSEDKLRLREEFLNIMRQRFLDGRDEEFDYSKVDASDAYDNLKILGQDEEDNYFQGEEPEIFNNDVNEEKMSTGSEEDDYLSDKILEKCCASGKC